MPQAIWNGKIIAETGVFETGVFETVEGNIYFPPDSIRREYFMPSDTTTICSWKGTAY